MSESKRKVGKRPGPHDVGLGFCLISPFLFFCCVGVGRRGFAEGMRLSGPAVKVNLLATRNYYLARPHHVVRRMLESERREKMLEMDCKYCP